MANIVIHTLAIIVALLLAPLAAVNATEPVAIDLSKRTWQGIPGLERTVKGRVFVSWFTGGTKEPEPENTVVLSHSDDGGKTFSAPQAMALPLSDGTRCYDPCLWIDPKGRLWYLFNRSVKDSTRHGVYARICDAPDASPPVWGAEFRVGFAGPFSFRMNKPIVLSTGEWIMPVTHALEPVAAWAGFDPKQVQGVGISTDEGKTWTLHGAVRTPGASLENMIVELKDGRLWMLIRTAKVLWESFSSDKGRTWTEGKPTTIATPHSRFFIRRLASGNLLLVNHYKFTGRSHLTAQLSTDDGKTWNEGLVLDERGGPNFPNGVPGGISYPDGVQDKDGLIWITYDRNRNGLGEILLARFREEDVAAGKNVSGAVTLRQVISTLGINHHTSLESRGLPRILFNNDSDDLKWPAYPEHHGALWVPAGDPLPLHGITSLDDYLTCRIEPLAKTVATGLAYCGNFGAPIWDLRRKYVAALGDDPLQPILQFWKRDGRTFFFSMRMNDKHHAVFNWAHLWDDFRCTHRHWFLKPPSDAEWKNEFLPWLNDPTPPAPTEMWAKVKTQPEALRAGPNREANGEKLLYDYSKAEVRSHYLATLREACRRYDLDGVELDWLRYPKFFRDGEVNAAVLTEFVCEARAILDETAKLRGHPLRLVTRVPDSPARARELGLDVEVWLKAGWVDAVIAGNGFTFGSNALGEWVSLAHRHRVPVYGVVERMPRGFARYGTPETLRAAAATLWARGADGLYTFNFYNTAEYPLLAELSDPARLAHLPKEFFVDTCSVTNNATVSEPPLPLNLKPGTPATIRLFIADDPAVARETSLEIFFKAEGEFEPPVTALNGQPLHELKSTRGKSDFTLILSSTALKHALKRGTNAFTLTSPTSVTVTALSVRVVP